MSNTFSLQQISQTGTLDSNLILRQCIFDLMARFMKIEAMNPNSTQEDIAEEREDSTSSLQRYRQDINMPSLYRIPHNSHKGRQKITNTNINDNSIGEHDVQRRQMISNVLAKPDTNTESTIQRTSNKRNKNFLKVGSMHQNIEINDETLDEILHNNNLQKELSVQIISNDETVRSKTVQDLKEFNSQFLATQVKKMDLSYNDA